MNPAELAAIDHRLHDVLSRLVREHGAQDVSWLAARARKQRRDARIDEDVVAAMVETSTMLVWDLQGRVRHLIEVLDGVILTHRVRSDTAGRCDLWVGCGLQPLTNLLVDGPLPLAGGGQVRLSPSGLEVIVGPDGWLPTVQRYELIGLRLRDGKLATERVAEQALPSLEEQGAVRRLLADHYRRERWWRGQEDLESRPAELVRALTLARMEDPSLLTTPYPPLTELLHNILERDLDEHYWRDLGSCQQFESVSFGLGNVPVALHGELSARAEQFGMALDQYVIAILGHLAWRTPFAEDCEPFEQWLPEQSTKPGKLLALQPRPADGE